MSSTNKKAQQEEHHIRTLGLECLTSIVRSVEISAGLYQPAEVARKGSDLAEGSTGNVSALDADEEVTSPPTPQQAVPFSSSHGTTANPSPSAVPSASTGSSFGAPVPAAGAGTSTVVAGIAADTSTIVDVFDKKQKFNEELETGILKFNLSPKAGLAYLAKTGHIEMTPLSVANFFHQVSRCVCTCADVWL